MVKNSIYYILVLYTVSVFGSMAMMSIGAGIASAAFIYLLFQKEFLKNIQIIPKKYFKITVIFSIACVWSLIWAKSTGLLFYGMSPQIDVYKHSYKLWHIWFPFLIVGLISYVNDKKEKDILKIWLLTALGFAVFGIIQYHFPIAWPQRLPHLDYDNYVKPVGIEKLYRGSYHANGLAGFHLSFASIFIFPTAVWFMLLAIKLQKEGLNKKTMLLGIGSILFFITNILTYSKTTWLVMPILVIAISLVMLTKKLKIPLVIVMTIFVLIGIQTSEFKLRFQGTDTMKERIEVWHANFEMIKQYPIFGVGWQQNSALSEAYYKAHQTNGFISHAHNNFLDQFAGTGVFGFVLFLIWNFLNIFFALEIYRKSDQDLYKAFGLGTVFAWGSFHFFGMTQTNFWDAKVMHQMGWVIALTLILYIKVMVESKSIKK